ncbi:hypothetical protein B0H21DRAFT_214972 [Amylocystis lapponica]|nr:hypothetical protein B0H21DRAFT_214972 [Amylocystis lapponica]
MAARHGLVSWAALPHVLLVLTLSLPYLQCAHAQPASVQFKDCFTGTNQSLKLSVSDVYAQVLDSGTGRMYLNFTVIGQTPQEIIESSDAENNASAVATTLFTTTQMLTFPIWDNNSFFCATLRSSNSSNPSGCPLPAGPFAFSTSIILPTNYELATFDTNLRALDPFQNELMCLDLNTTILKPGPVHSVYGHASIIFWISVSLALAYWLLVGIARLVSAWGRGSARSGSGVWARVESAGFIIASAISGERLASSPALMRFCKWRPYEDSVPIVIQDYLGTPSLRDIIFHTQWCSALAMVAVQWPEFTYPLLSQTAWSTLSYNITLTQGHNAGEDHFNPLAVPSYTPPSNFADQLNDPNSVIYIDPDAPNLLFQLPGNATAGISSFAWSIGVRPEDLFGICLALFLAIIGAVIVLSAFVWGLDFIISSMVYGGTHATSALGGTRSPRYSSASKDMLDGVGVLPTTDDHRSLNSHLLFRSFPLFKGGRPWWRLRTEFVSYHGSILQGNLTRLLILFHLPVTIFSCYQMTLGRSAASLSSIILAAISFALFSVLLPVWLVFRLTTTKTTKLYDETWTLLSLGPLYNHYRHGSQLFACLLFATNLAFGITIGCGQKSGTAQAIIILVVEVASALGTSVWLPWGQGASMGLISFLFCVGRIVIAVLLVILAPIVSVDSGAAQWIAYAIFCILALVYLAFLLMLLVKLVEAMFRIFGGVGFHKSRRVVDSGLLGTLGLLGCCSSRRSHRRSKPRSRSTPSDISKQQSSVPLTRPTPPPPFRDVTPTGSGPPSVLRPEHALQPYKEDSDDETGYIMGAWQPFPGPGYTAVEEPRAPEPQKSGFSRVGGGRAHFESPYAIASGSTHTFPSVERNLPSSSLATSSMPADYSPPPTPSIASAARLADVNLPPSAMSPAHIRNKSQTAVIENAAALLNVRPFSSSDPTTRDDAQFASADEDAQAQPKKHWYNRRKSRRMSESDTLSAAAPSQGPDTGRSFVVVRKPRPGVPPAERESLNVEPVEPGRGSFSVLRSSNAT